MTSKLHLRKEEDEAPSENCPSCGAPMAPESVICVACGYDKRTGRRADDVPPPRLNPVVVGGLALVILLALGVAAYRLLRADDVPASLPAAPVAAAPIAPPPPAPTSAPEVVVAPVEPATAATGSVESADADTNEVETAAPAVDWDAVLAAQLEAARTQLDRVAPLFALGEKVELRLTNGLVHRGVLRDRSPEHCTLAVASNDVRTLPLATLDRATRVRLDPAFRGRYVEHHAAQRVDQLRNATNAPPEP